MSGTVGRTITVSVTAADIDNGIRGDCWACPIALALWRATGEKWEVNGIDAYPVGRSRDRVILPESVRGWINKFDRALFPPPMEFELTVTVPETDSVSQPERTIA